MSATTASTPDPDAFADLARHAAAELRPGERLIWAGRPTRVPPMSLAGCVAAVGCLGVAYLLTGLMVAAYLGLYLPRIEPNESHAIFSTIFVVFSVLATIAWFIGGISDFVERHKVAREVYAMTDRRILIWAPGAKRGSTQVVSHDTGHFDRLIRDERPDGTGDLAFSNSRGRRNPGPCEFREIADVRRVEALALTHQIRETPDTPPSLERPELDA